MVDTLEQIMSQGMTPSVPVKRRNGGTRARTPKTQLRSRGKAGRATNLIDHHCVIMRAYPMMRGRKEMKETTAEDSLGGAFSLTTSERGEVTDKHQQMLDKGVANVRRRRGDKHKIRILLRSLTFFLFLSQFGQFTLNLGVLGECFWIVHEIRLPRCKVSRENTEGRTEIEERNIYAMES